MITNISVVITAYNLSDKIGVCLKELKQQTFSQFDIVVIDDCSTDNTREVIDELKPLFGERLKTVFCSQNNGSPGITRNIALDSGLITGEYIVFLDGDDNIEPDFLEKMYEKACSENADIVCCGYNRVNSSTGKEYSKEMCSFYTQQITRSSGYEYIALINGSLWNKLIRLSCIGSKRIQNIKVGEDATFLLNLFGGANKIVFLNDILIHYNVYERSLMSTIPQREIIKLSDEFIRLYSLADEEYKNTIVFSVFIHIGISACVRAYQSKKINTHEHLVWTKEYLDKNFPDWSKSKYLKLGNLRKLGLKGIAMKVCVWLYILGLFRIFLWAYNFMITKMGKDIKW